MSKSYGKTVKNRKIDSVSARWIANSSSVEFKVSGLEYVLIISEYDLRRMIWVDNFESFSFKSEKGEIDDETFEIISLIQTQFYVTKNLLRVVKHAWRENNKYPAWVGLKPRVARGGRKKGVHIVNPVEVERIENLIANYDEIVNNCVRRDWLEEYINLNLDIAKYKGDKVSKRALREKFVELRNKLSL